MLPNDRAVLALSLVPGLGGPLIKNLLAQVPEAQVLFKMSVEQLMQLEDIGPARAKAIKTFAEWGKVDSLVEKGLKTGASIVTLANPQYPSLLRQIFDPPPVLWVLGSVSALETPGIAVVGTRSPSAYGRRLLAFFMPALLEAELTIYSGLAYGVDTLAHHYATDANRCTVAVLGSGIDRIYPATNNKLVQQIIETGGAVITEFLPGTAPDAVNFPARNRIVSGLSRGVFVVESAVEGGSMITARVALDQSRDVFAAPHPIDNPRGTGCNTLIRDGLAKLVITPDDIISELNLSRFTVQHQNAATPLTNNQRSAAHLTASQQRILDLLEGVELHIDEMTVKLQRDIRDLNIDLFELEMEGWVRQLAGKRFIRAD